MKYAYSNGFILDGSENMEPVSGKVILTNGDKIERIISDEELIGLAGYEKINLGGRYIMPGLVNMHSQSSGNRKTEEKRIGSGQTCQIDYEQRIVSEDRNQNLCIRCRDRTSQRRYHNKNDGRCRKLRFPHPRPN